MPATGSSTTTASGLLIEWTETGIGHAVKYVGEDNVPHDIRWRRRQVYDMMRHMGTPVLVKHMYNADDVQRGIAVRSDNYDPTYGSTRHNDPLSHGVGFNSVELSDDEWVMPDGTLVRSDTQPTGGKRAAKYRGFGPGWLIYMIQPDTAQDLFKVTESGVFIKVQNATAQAPWYPEINDNDLIINCELGRNGAILTTNERFQAKMTNPISIRGTGDRYGRKEYTEDGGNRYMINQQFEMSLIPEFDELYKVEVDR
jgi:hypothetical protein